MSILNELQWRFATKKMNGQSIPAEKLETILESIRLSASSYGLQPFKVIVVSNTDLKNKIQEASYNQPQVGSSSHILVFAIPEKLTAADIESYINLIASTRGIAVENLEQFKQTMLHTVGALPIDKQEHWCAKQAYIALGTALLVAAEQKVDTCPMEGFEHHKVAEILSLNEKGLKPVVMLPLGYRDETDSTTNYKKVRKAKAELFIEMA